MYINLHSSLPLQMEGDSGLVARTFGTCVLIQRKETKEMVQFMANNNNPKKSSSHRVTKSSTSNELTHHHHHHHDESPHKEMARNTGMVMTLMNEATSAARQREDAQEVAVSVVCVCPFQTCTLTCPLVE